MLTNIQFWTESGGTSYGKLTLYQIKNVLIPVPSEDEIYKIKEQVSNWSISLANVTRCFHDIWQASDKVVILNSPVIGLDCSSFFDKVSDEEEIQ